MDAMDFFKTANRLCKGQGCKKCPACKDSMCMVMRMIRLDDNSVKNIEETISKVEEWAKDHPVKTRQSEFLKLFPNAAFYNNVIKIPPCSIEKEMRENCLSRDCFGCRRDYWLTEVPDND